LALSNEHDKFLIEKKEDFSITNTLEILGCVPINKRTNDQKKNPPQIFFLKKGPLTGLMEKRRGNYWTRFYSTFNLIMNILVLNRIIQIKKTKDIVFSH